MSESREGLDFSTVIASTVHDMKNSLAMLTQTHNQWIRQMPEALLHTREHGVIEYEFARLNGMLVQLLGLYKLGVNHLPMRPGYHEVEDFLQAQLARAACGQAFVMADQDQRGALGVIELEQQVRDHAAGGGVEIAGRLVSEHDVWPPDERPGDRHALLLTPRERVRPPMREVRDPQLFEESVGRSQRRGPFTPRDQRPEQDVVARRERAE